MRAPQQISAESSSWSCSTRTNETTSAPCGQRIARESRRRTRDTRRKAALFASAARGSRHDGRQIEQHQVERGAGARRPRRGKRLRRRRRRARRGAARRRRRRARPRRPAPATATSIRRKAHRRARPRRLPAAHRRAGVPHRARSAADCVVVSPRSNATGSREIVVEQRVVLDEGGDGGIAEHRGAEIGERKAAVAGRARRASAPPRRAAAARVASKVRPSSGPSEPRRARPVGEPCEHVEPHAGREDLRIDEAGAEIEQRARLFARDGAGERKRSRPALKSRDWRQAGAASVRNRSPSGAVLALACAADIVRPRSARVVWGRTPGLRRGSPCAIPRRRGNAGSPPPPRRPAR